MECSDKELKNKLLDILDCFITICTEYNLRYSISYGTLLGAIRHNGFIPWDDDIDVIMPRPDYEKLLSISDKHLKGKYKVISIYNDMNYIYPFAKIYDTETTLIEYKEMFYLGGIYIDIFPIDGITQNPHKHIKKIYKTQYAAIHLLKAQQSRGYMVKIFPKYLIYKLRFKNYHAALILCDKLAQKHPFKEGNDSISYFGGCKEKDIIKHSWFNPLKEYNFEGRNVLGPNNFNAYLSQIYNDYMTPPPMENRVSNHSHYFIDLSRRYTLKEIRDMGY